MKTLAELDLPHLPMEEASFGEDPLRYFSEARAKHPWLATCKFGLVVHQYTAIRELYIQDDKLRPPYAGIVERLGLQGTPWGRFTEEQMISLPPEQHRFLRDTLVPKFTPRSANQLRPMMRDTISRLLDEWVPKRRIDFEEFASHFPISVMFTLVGAPLEGVRLLRDDLEAIGLAQSLELDRFPRIQDAMVRLEAFVTDAIAERRARRRTDGVEDLLEILIRTEDEGKANARQITDLIMFFFIAGYDTSKNVLTYTMYTLLEHRDIYRRCADDSSYCQRVIEEGLRWYNPGTVPRIVNQDLLYRDVLLPRETMLFFPLSISGRDPTSFPNADVFNPDRVVEPGKRQIAFGLGKHMCLGQYIARTQLQEALHQVAQRMREPRLVGDFGWRPFFGTWGMKGLPLEFDPAPARAEH
jgi:cytochrome P450